MLTIKLCRLDKSVLDMLEMYTYGTDLFSKGANHFIPVTSVHLQFVCSDRAVHPLLREGLSELIF